MAASPTMRRRRLAGELRRLRSEAGLSIEEVASTFGWQPSKLSRTENRQIGITTSDLRKLLGLYQVEDRQYYNELLDMARRATERGWWQSYGSDVVPQALGNLIGLEAEARTIRSYEPELVPGLLQTEGYARAIMRAWQPGWAADDIDRRVEVRLGRQEILTRVDPPAPSVTVILNEGVLRRMVGGHEVMREQIQHLANEKRERANVVVQVLPYTAREHPAMVGPFTMLTFLDAEDLGVVHIENFTGALDLEKPDELRRYEEMWAALQAKSLSPDDSRTMMRTYALR